MQIQLVRILSRISLFAIFACARIIWTHEREDHDMEAFESVTGLIVRENRLDYHNIFEFD
jgi:hypothetical protein